MVVQLAYNSPNKARWPPVIAGRGIAREGEHEEHARGGRRSYGSERRREAGRNISIAANDRGRCKSQGRVYMYEVVHVHVGLCCWNARARAFGVREQAESQEACGMHGAGTPKRRAGKRAKGDASARGVCTPKIVLRPQNRPYLRPARKPCVD